MARLKEKAGGYTPQSLEEEIEFQEQVGSQMGIVLDEKSIFNILYYSSLESTKRPLLTNY